MIKLYYKDAYDTERCQVFENPNDFIRVLMGCVTVPDNYPITKMTYKDKDIATVVLMEISSRLLLNLIGPLWTSIAKKLRL